MLFNCSAVQLIPAFVTERITWITERIHERLPEEFGRGWEGCKGTGRGRVLNQVLRWCLAQGLVP